MSFESSRKVPVLVTGGAGYIGSHAVLALTDADWPVAVIDNLTTGFRWAVPDGVAFYEGDIADAGLLARICAEQGTRAIMHFAGSIVVPDSVSDPLGYYLNNTVKSRALARGGGQGGCAALHLQLDRRDLWRARRGARERGNPARTDQSLRHEQADDRGDARRHRAGPSAELLRAALFQRRGGRSGGSRRAIDRRGHPPDQDRGRGRTRQARQCRRLRHRLRHARRDRGARLYPRRRSRRRAPARARGADRRARSAA